ncbi:cytochrome d ubiquinol oxidase subunit II [Flavisolibacter sp. BT320]|nr:cytochrome d ubiquinol oxidase subunit II [Flavisolibacter longurius]
MKRTAYLFLVLLALSGLAGYLLSKASMVGRVGISLFYKEYAFLKVWWQAGLLVLVVWMTLFFLLGWVQLKLSFPRSRLVFIITLVLALVGVYFTYQDFRHNLSHRWLGERFHLGGYLFWIGWMLVCLFHLTEKKKALPEGGSNRNDNDLSETKELN